MKPVVPVPVVLTNGNTFDGVLCSSLKARQVSNFHGATPLKIGWTSERTWRWIMNSEALDVTWKSVNLQCLEP